MLISLQQNTTPTVTPYLLTFNSMLQMTTQELETYLYRQVEKNPLLEIEWVDAGFSPLSCSDSVYQEKTVYREKTEWDSYYGSVDMYGSAFGLYDHLSAQLREISIAPTVKKLCDEIIERLDADGRLDEPLEEIAKDLGVSYVELETALRIVQSLDPAGVAARSLQECLFLQLERYYEDPLSESIVNNYLDDLGKKHFNQIARSMGISDKEVRGAYQKVLSLNPRPCDEFSHQVKPHYIYPDIRVSVHSERICVESASSLSFILYVNEEYISLLKKEGDLSDQKYLAEHHAKAANLLRGVKQRDKTIGRIGELIVQWQSSYFLDEGNSLKPMNLADIAKQASVHESTVSRAARGKFIQSDRGLQPMNYFFARKIGKEAHQEEAVSVHQVKDRIAALIKEEPQKKPLSDQKIASKLEEEGIMIARRTVAKYRDALGIMTATARKTS